MEKFKFNIQLKQHTPMFQFQHEQDGATLRGTEVKPKLDRFIIEKITGKKGKEAFKEMKEIHPAWLVGGAKGQHPALDYKLNITIVGKPDNYIVASSIPRHVREYYDNQTEQKYISNAPYFADNELIKNKKLDDKSLGKAIISDGVNLNFFSLHTDLNEQIKAALPIFFALENFGLRQSKGFGAFYPADASIDDFENAISKICPDGTLRFTVRHRNEDERIQNIFKKIDSEYKVLKGGFAKDPSQIMEYFEKEGVTWEKIAIKRELVKGRGIPRKEDYTADDETVKYVRALLGVAELYEFPRDNSTKIEIKNIKLDPKLKLDPDERIDRFRSPIIFKVFDDTIYITWREIPDELYNATFEFKNKSTRHSIYIKTPSASTPLNLKDFIFNHVENTWNEL